LARVLLNYALSKAIGNVTEIAVMAPIKKGRIPGERRTYEARLRFVISTLQSRVQRGIPTELDKVPTIHFGRMIIIRPEQYLVYSNVPGVTYENPGAAAADPQDAAAVDPKDAVAIDPKDAAAAAAEPGKIPAQMDDFEIVREGGKPGEKPYFRSWLLTLVSFDGDLKVYFKDIATLLDTDFDRVFRNCEDFPTVRDFEAFWGWIRRYQINVDLFYPRYANLSMVRIKELEDFKRRFDEFVATVRSPTGQRVQDIDELFDEFLRKSQQHARDFPTPGGIFKSDKC
jgi:hypothetical protein